MNRKVKSFEETVFLSEQCDNKCSKSSLSALTQVHNCFLTWLLSCR